MSSTKPSERLWRTLVVLERDSDGEIWIHVPGWEPRLKLAADEQFLRTEWRVPETIAEQVPETGLLHVHAKVNIGAASPYDLNFDAWEDPS